MVHEHLHQNGVPFSFQGQLSDQIETTSSNVYNRTAVAFFTRQTPSRRGTGELKIAFLQRDRCLPRCLPFLTLSADPHFVAFGHTSSFGIEKAYIKIILLLMLSIFQNIALVFMSD
jgi:hypothetical protein